MAIVWSMTSGLAVAQSVSEVLTFLMTNQAVVTGSVERDRAAAQAASDAVSRALLASLATIPLTNSSGAFVYKLNPVLGTAERATRSFGPFVVERALTAGARDASIGLAFQHMRFTSLDGRNLRNGSLVTTANQFVDEAAPFDTDRLALDIDADLATFHGNLGLTHWLDVGIAVPVMTLRLEGTRVDTYRNQTFTQSSASSTALGLADMLIRTKWMLFQEDGTGLAAAVDVRLPTGRKEDLLGTGETSLKVTAIGSIEGSRLSSHANFGLTVGGLTNELSYGAALAVNAHSRFTLTGEVTGRWMSGIGRIEDVTALHPTLSNVETIRLASASSSGVHAVAFSSGFKWNVLETWLLVSNVSVPLTNGGLTTRFVPYVGLEYAIAH
jgi:hypothetical protein